MSTAPPNPPTPPTPPPASPVPKAAPPEPTYDRVTVYQHSNIFYWWPVWAFGFLFSAISFFDGHQMAIVPVGTKAYKDASVTDRHGKEIGENRDVLVLEKGKSHLVKKDESGHDVIVQPSIYVSRYRGLGTTFLFILLIVIFITNLTLRGQWSLIVLVFVSALVVIFWLAGFWEIIFERLGNLSIYINLGGYMMISLVVFVLWLLNFFFFDRQVYVVFTPGQVRVCLELGSGETIYDTMGMVVQKQRSDLFRHTILGFGSGDVILRFAKIDHPIELHNILNINQVLRRIETMTKEKIVIAEAPPPNSQSSKT